MAQKARERQVAAKGWGTQSQPPLVPPTPLVMPGSQLLLKHGGSTPGPPTRGPSFLFQATLGHPFISLVNILQFSHGFRLSGSKAESCSSPWNLPAAELVGGNGKQSQLPTGRRGREKKLHAQVLSEDSIFGMCFLGSVQLLAV